MALDNEISMDNNMLNTQSIHEGGIHNHTTSGSCCSRACNTVESLRILLMLQLFCCKGIDLHTQEDVAAGSCRHRGCVSCLRRSSSTGTLNYSGNQSDKSTTCNHCSCPSIASTLHEPQAGLLSLSVFIFLSKIWEAVWSFFFFSFLTNIDR